MNPDREIDRLLDVWLEDGPTGAPDRMLDVLADRIARQRQRPAWRLDWRHPTMHPAFKVGVGIAAVLLIAVVGWNLLPDRSAVIGGPSPVPTPSASPTAPPSASASPRPSLVPEGCAPSDPACLGPLAAGRHSTRQLITPITYQVPDGWLKILEVPGSFSLELRDAPEGTIAVVPDWAAAAESPCTPDVPAAEPGIGHTAGDLVAWLKSHPGLTVTALEPITIDGLAGQVLDVAKVPDYTGACSSGAVNLFTHTGTIGDGGAWDIGDSARMRLYILDTPDGHTATVMIVVDPPTKFDAIVRAATPVIESITFE